MLFPWCTAITGYLKSSDNSKSQRSATDKQAKSLPGTSQPGTVKTATNGMYMWQFYCKCANIIPTVLYMSSGLICGCITGIHDRKIVMSCVMWNLSKFIRILRLLSSILSVYYFVILYAPNNSQVMLNTCFLINFFIATVYASLVPLGLINIVVSYLLQNFNASGKILITFLSSY